ncbi:alpha/beta hydrolase fold [Lentzea waywayandensis]|uniref:Alpha/beta hydrolase fold n=1 Tax=Lentzea waywayandensis TaxID=84724 RepID=A0A1I6DFA0_9PSEU|nr:alpha/beta hydrolase [Lentzea waywayandensis]SFR04125.1 alpha/beta hydrolase fold [Lentzea waywayandensis]
MKILAMALTLALLPITPASATPALPFQPCTDVPEADCATLTVPVDRDHPDGPQIALAVARRKATDPARRIGVLMVNPGGPGGSAARYAKDAPKVFSEEVLARFDVVGYDPRGVGDSNPIYCDTSAVGLPYPSGRPDTPERFAQLTAYNHRLTEDCRTRTGPVFDRVDAQSAVRDMDDLRKSLGEKQITYYGMSYGTLYGQKYAERYGKHVRAMVIDSVVDASLPLDGLLTAGARAGEDIFTEFVRWCGATPSCALHGKDIPALYADLRARAARGGLHTPGAPDQPLTPTELANRTVRFGYSPDFARMGNYFTDLAAQPEAGFGTATRRTQAVLCQDFTGHPASAADVAAMDSHVRAAAPNVQASPIWDQALTWCAGWQGPTLNPARPWRPAAAPQVLMLNSLHDPATGYESAVSVHRQARGKAALVTYEGTGHGVYTRTPCTRAVTDSYLLDRTVPRDGLRCPAV